MAIAFVNAAAASGHGGSNTSETITLPGSIIAGNLLIAFLVTNATGTQVHAWPAGWTKFDQQAFADGTRVGSLAYRIATGSDTNPVVTWTGNATTAFKTWQYSGNKTTAPIGATSFGSGSTSPHSSASITATAAGSAAIYFDYVGTNAALTVPSGYSSSFSDAATGHMDAGIKQLTNTGDTTGAISTAGGGASWGEWQVELLAPFSGIISTSGALYVGGAATFFPLGDLASGASIFIGGAADMQFRSAFVLTSTAQVFVGGAATWEFPTAKLNETLPAHDANGFAITGTVLTTDATLPPHTLESFVLAGGVLSGDNDLPLLTIVGDFGWFAANALPAPSLEASVLVGNVSSGALTLPVYALAAAQVATNLISGASDLPVYVMQASAVGGGIGTAALLIPVHELVAAGFSGAVLTADLDLPLYALVAAGIGPYTFSGDNALPVYQLNAALSAAVVTAFRAWVLNLHNKALTEYTNFGFNSFASYGGRLFAAGPGGIVELTEQTSDNGTVINSTVRTGKHNFGATYAKRVPRIYVAVATPGDLEFRTITGADGRRGYLLPWNQTTELQQRRVPIGRGPKAVYWQFEMVNRGSDFELDAFVIRPELTLRRVV